MLWLLVFIVFFIPVRDEVWNHKTSLTPPRLIEVHVPS